jgi:translation initiation factor IF-2
LEKPVDFGAMKDKSLVTGSSVPRPPIVTIMGHIDHGKTTLLDKIRQSNIASKESGGITQHIGAYQISFRTKDGQEKKITFIDTPGHAAFAKMRARGAKVTDIVVLVVAADEGVKEQTKECLDHIKAAGTPFLVAINKIDLPNASVDKVKGELAEVGVVSEDFGGNVTMVPVSAKTGEGIDQLLEMVTLMAEVEGLSADPKGRLEGVIIESKMDPKRGPVASLLVRNGTLRVGEQIWVEEQNFKVRALMDEKGKRLNSVLPSGVAEVLGFNSLPPVGARVSSAPLPKSKQSLLTEKKAIGSFEEFFAKEEEKKVSVVIKADTQGTLEAIVGNLPKEIEIVHQGIGEVNESDVFLAQSTKSLLIVFRVAVSGKMKKLADDYKVDIAEFELIYELFDYLEKQALENIDPTASRLILGKAKIVAEFNIGKKRIAGCRVLEGEISKNQKAFLQRNSRHVADVRITSMKRLKEDIKIAKKGEEFGVLFSPSIDFKVGDVILSYKDSQDDTKD